MLSTFLSASRPFIPLTLSLLILFLLPYAAQQTVTTYLTPLSWLSSVCLLAAAGLAWQFGQSRVVWGCALFMLFISSAELPLLTLSDNEWLLVLCAATSLLSVQGNTGLYPRNILLTFLQLAIAMTLAWSYLNYASDAVNALLISYWSQTFGPNHPLSVAFTPAEFLLFSTLSLVVGLTAIIRADQTTICITALFIALCILFSTQNMFWLAVTPCWVSALCILGILTDSFTMAFRDELTGIASRRALQQFVPTLGRKYVVVMSDIDHFKQFNDKYGHDVGDQVLRLVASKLDAVGGSGKAFRYGGEEFTIVFTGKSIAFVEEHIETLRQTIASYPIVIRAKDRPNKRPKSVDKKSSTKNRTVHVTCSFGISERNPNYSSFEGVLKRADEALYDAKKAGRNCFRVRS